MKRNLFGGLASVVLSVAGGCGSTSGVIPNNPQSDDGPEGTYRIEGGYFIEPESVAGNGLVPGIFEIRNLGGGRASFRIYQDIDDGDGPQVTTGTGNYSAAGGNFILRVPAATILMPDIGCNWTSEYYLEGQLRDDGKYNVLVLQEQVADFSTGPECSEYAAFSAYAMRISK